MFRSSVRSLGRSAQPQAIKVRPPTLLIWGARDVALSSELVQPSLALCEAARLVYYEEATHWVQHDLPSQVTQEMLSFIA
jgi:pimeloyl-ACP methyl ester carboxylesterase